LFAIFVGPRGLCADSDSMKFLLVAFVAIANPAVPCLGGVALWQRHSAAFLACNPFKVSPSASTLWWKACHRKTMLFRIATSYNKNAFGGIVAHAEEDDKNGQIERERSLEIDRALAEASAAVENAERWAKAATVTRVALVLAAVAATAKIASTADSLAFVPISVFYVSAVTYAIIFGIDAAAEAAGKAVKARAATRLAALDVVELPTTSRGTELIASGSSTMIWPLQGHYIMGFCALTLMGLLFFSSRNTVAAFPLRGSPSTAKDEPRMAL